MSRIRKAVIPAAGLGSRFYPLTRAQPKEMLPIIDKPIIHYVVEEALSANLDEILIIVGSGKDAIINYFDSNHLDDKFQDNTFKDFPDIYFVRQKQQLGLADSIKYSEKFVDGEPFVVLLGDTIYKSAKKESVTSQIVSVFKKWKALTIAVEEVPPYKISDYGIISGEKIEKQAWNITSMIEKPSLNEAPSNLGITGTYVLTDSIFDELRNLKPGRNGEYQLTDALSSYCTHDQLIGYEFEGIRYDIGTKELWIKTFFEFARNDERYSKLL